MSIIPGGVKITGFISPNDSLDTYAVTDPFYGLGSLRTVGSIIARDAITSERREDGMLVFVKEDNQYYKMTSGLTNSDWTILDFSSTISVPTINVSATGLNNYLGTATPSITGYNANIIYLTLFDTINTSASTINIDTLGVLNLYKSTSSGLTGLYAGDIQTGVTYYLTYDGANMQFFTSNPAPTSTATYTNPAPTTATLGGIAAGSTFSAQTIQQMFDALLYPYQAPGFSSFSRTNLATTYELGQTVSIGSQTFTWGTSNSPNVSAGTVSITQNFSPSKTLFSNGNIFSTATTLSDTYSAGTSTTTTLYSINATNTHGASLSSSISRSWRPKWYYGKFSGATVNSSELVTLGASALVSSVVNTYYTIGSSVGAEYIYFAIPNTLMQPSDFRDSTGGCFGTNHPYLTQGTVSVVNTYGVTVNYTVYRFTNPTAGGLNAWLCP